MSVMMWLSEGFVLIFKVQWLIRRIVSGGDAKKRVGEIETSDLNKKNERNQEERK